MQFTKRELSSITKLCNTHDINKATMNFSKEKDAVFVIPFTSDIKWALIDKIDKNTFSIRCRSKNTVYVLNHISFPQVELMLELYR